MQRPWHTARCLLLVILFALAPPAASGSRAQPAEPSPKAGGWRAELTGDLLTPWTRHARDTLHGAFRTHLDRRWRPTGPPEKYPSMLGRHLFSYSAGYLLTGEERWLARADSVYRYLVRHGWDERHGGWFDRLTRTGEPADVSKSTFVQVYAATGLTLYHFVTRRPEVLDRIRRTNRLLETRFRDDESGGYFQQLERDFAVADSSKTAASQLAPVSGHLLYLYAGTRDTAYLRQAERLMRNVTGRMRDPETGWIRERFSPDWRPAPGSDAETFNVGHNTEVAWLLARLHLATAGGADSGGAPGDEASGYRGQALVLGERVAGAGYLEGAGAWIQTVPRPEARPGASPPDSGRVLWWIQAYGNMTELTLHRVRRGTARPGGAGSGLGGATPSGPHLRRYRAGVTTWRRHLLDHRFGAALTAVAPGGEILQGGKGGRWKTSYHAMEHALWNHVGERLWLTPSGSVTLHFRPEPSGDAAASGRRICPRLVPDPAVEIRSAWRGDRRLETDPEQACFRVRSGGPTVRVELTSAPTEESR